MADFWNSLTPRGQAALIALVGGLVVTVIIGILKRAWSGFADTDGRIKQAIVVVVATVLGMFVGGIELGAGISVVAITLYNLWRTWIAEPVANGQVIREVGKGGSLGGEGDVE